MRVVGAIEPNLRRAEIERAKRKRPDSFDAYDLYLRALPFASWAIPEDADAALPLLEQAIQHEPDYAAAHVLLGREAEATASARRLLELQPGFTIASLVDSAFTNSERLALLAEALRRAGLPE